MDTVLAGVAPVDFFDDNGKLVMTASALTDAGLNVAVSEDVFRAGNSNSRLGSYFYDSNLAFKFTTPIFTLEYLAQKLGSVIEAGGDVFTIEEVTTTVANTITVNEFTPVAPFDGSTVVYGWYKLQNESTWNSITFTGSTATVSNLPSGTKVCVKYAYADAGARSFKVSASIIPNILRAVMRVPMLKTGTAQESYVSSSKVGELQVKVPKLQFDPNTDLALTSSGHATVELGGNALINYGGGCGSDGYYAELVEVIYGKDEFANVKEIAVANGDVELAVAGTSTLKVYAIYSDGTASSPIDNSKLTFVSDAPSKATVGSHTGLCTGVATGTANIAISITSKPTVSTVAVATVA